MRLSGHISWLEIVLPSGSSRRTVRRGTPVKASTKASRVSTTSLAAGTSAASAVPFVDGVSALLRVQTRTRGGSLLSIFRAGTVTTSHWRGSRCESPAAHRSLASPERLVDVHGRGVAEGGGAWEGFRVP